ncbi:transcriptional coactivator Hfi1/transcriptional adapter 1 [Tanacetum coccineum]
MPAAVRHCSRVDTIELKLEMETRLGTQKAEKYFNLLTRFLSLKVGKSEFDKNCVRLIGRENVRYHNDLLKAIVRNAAVCNTPPLAKQAKRDGVNGIDPRNGLLCRDVFPQSPKKGRTPNIRERKFKDRPNHLVTTKHTSVENGKEVERDEMRKRIPITAPFGVSVYSNKKRKVLQKGLGMVSLEERLKEKLKTEGLDISMDCVNLLNNGLTSYLTRVIEPSLELARLRSLRQPGTRFTASILDFRLATETNPKVLGEDWPTKLEKICFGSSRKLVSE